MRYLPISYLPARHFPFFLIVLALTSQPGLAAERDIVARMGDLSLSEADVRGIVKTLPAEARGVQAMEQSIRTELIRKSLAAEARSRAFDKKPEVEARMQQAAEQVLVTSYMNNIAQPPADFPTPELLNQAYEANKDALKTPKQYRLRQIYLVGKDDKARKLAEQLVSEANRKGASFATLARKQSQHAASASKGGDMGWLNENDLAPAFREPLSGLAVGGISQPVAGAEGLHILKLEERKEPELQSLDKVRDLLVRNLRLRKAAQLEQAYLEAMLQRTPISLNGIALEEISKR